MNAENDAYEKPLVPIQYLMSEYLEKITIWYACWNNQKIWFSINTQKVKQTKINRLLIPVGKCVQERIGNKKNNNCIHIIKLDQEIISKYGMTSS